jgi:hypothetical protein
MRRVLEIISTPILAGVIAAAFTGAATAHDGTVFRGFGTAVLNGSFSGGEWDSAGRKQFDVARSPAEGGGIVPATLYVMNDAQNLYIAIRVSNASAGGSRFFISFDNTHDGRLQEGEDSLHDDGSGQLLDRFMHQTSPTLWTPLDDNANGGTLDGAFAQGDDAGVATFEVAHPLDDADNAHDFSLRAGDRLGVSSFDFLHCTSPLFETCASSTSSLSSMDIVVLSGSTIPPDTQITVGQDEGSMTPDADLMFEFTGSDDVLEASQLTFQCKLDEGVWQACTSPQEFSVADGRHTFLVRAIDDMDNLDPSPAERNWIRDSTAPSKPVIRGRRSVRKGQKLVLRFSASDEFTPRSGIRFKCSVDSRRLKSCRATYRARLRPGRHVVRARALDLVGNQSGITRVRIIVKRPRAAS